MPRSIKSDNKYRDKLLKLIPSEIVAAYLFLQGFFAGEPASLELWLAWGVFAVLLIFTPLYLSKVHKVSDWKQIVITTISFPVWVYSLGGPFELMGWYIASVASIILVLWTLAIPLLITLPEEPATAKA